MKTPILQAIAHHLNQNGIPTDTLGPTSLDITKTHYYIIQKTNTIQIVHLDTSRNKAQIPIQDPDLLDKITNHLKQTTNPK